jgi:nitrate/nitrite-specific signal transduction histidine kinase
VPSGNHFQRDFTLKIVVLFVAFGALLLLLIRWACVFTLRDLELQQDTVVPAVLDVVSWVIVIGVCVFLPLLALLCIRLTHRVVGPVDRIIATVHRMAQGQFSGSLTLRKGDVLQPLADAINRLAAARRA